LIDELRAAGHEARACGVILANGRPPMTLQEALSSHAMKHAAEGQLYRQALISAGEALGLRVVAATERDLDRQAAVATGTAEHLVRGRVEALGRELGPPWAQDQKLAALVAWIALATAGRPRRR
jgi:hypothetical protein